MKKGNNTRKQHSHKRARIAVPKTLEQYLAKSDRFQVQWNTVAHVISKMRSDAVSLRKAASEYGIDPRTVVRLGGSALKKAANGRYTAKRSDGLLRVLAIPTVRGITEVAVLGSREARRIGEYFRAVRQFIRTGDSSALLPFLGKSVKAADGSLVPFITDPMLLRRLGRAGEFAFESLYGRAA